MHKAAHNKIAQMSKRIVKKPSKTLGKRTKPSSKKIEKSPKKARKPMTPKKQSSPKKISSPKKVPTPKKISSPKKVATPKRVAASPKKSKTLKIVGKAMKIHSQKPKKSLTVVPKRLTSKPIKKAIVSRISPAKPVQSKFKYGLRGS